MKGVAARKGILRPEELGACKTIRIRLYQSAARNPLKFLKVRKCHDKIIVFFFAILTTLEK